MSESVVIDTNAYVAFMQGEPWAYDIISTRSTILLPFVVLGELYFGFFNGSKPQENLQKLNSFLKSARVQVLNLSDNTAHIYGQISAELAKSGKPIQTNDVWIAALCREHSYPVATHDKGFQNITGLEILT
jgi:tRNA(fMet)-specific endonuclease VapC